MAHDANDDDREKGVDPAKYWKWVIWVLIFLCSIFFVKGIVNYFQESNYNNLLPKPEITAQTVIVKQGKEKKIYYFNSEKRSYHVLLTSDAEFYPKGGKITITNPNGETWDDEPGTSHNRGSQPAGWYTVNQKGSKTWGVEIWN